MTRTVTLLTIGLILATPAATAAPATAFTVTSWRAVGPDPGALDGSLAALLLEDLDQTTDAPAVPPFHLQAGSLRVEMDWAEVGVHAGIARPAATPTNTRTDNYTAASLEEVGNRAGYKVDVVAEPGLASPSVTLSEGCFELRQIPDTADTRDDGITRKSIVNGARPDTQVSLAHAALAASCGRASITVSGAFRLHIWQTDLTLRDGKGETALLQSGNIPTWSQDAVVPTSVGRDQEFYIHVAGGVLQFPFTPQVVLYMRDMSGDIDGEVVLDHAHGQLDTGADAMQVDDQRLLLRGGPMHLEVTAHGGDPMQLTVSGAWREADLGSTTVARVEPPLQTASALPMLLVVVVLGAVALRRRV